MKSVLRARRAVTLAAWLVAVHTLLAYGLPVALFAALAIGLGIGYWRLGTVGATVVSASLIAATLLYGLVLRITGLDNAIYYRPDEILTEFRNDLGHRAYRRDTVFNMRMPHGDLQPMTSARIGIPRDVVYRIDRYGFRNDADYAGEPYVLVGDSFIAGSSNTQDSLLSSKLRRHGIAAYNLAHPGGLPDYASYVEQFARRHSGFRVLLFVFEGNDFEFTRKQSTSGFARFWKRYYEMFSETAAYRVTKSLIKRVTRRNEITGAAYVTVRELGGQRLAFLTRYVDATRSGELVPNDEFERALTKLKPYLAQVFFIPTNYRLYYRALEGPDAPPLPDAKWAYLKSLCQRERLSCTNLTVPLTTTAEQALARGELLWWPDDSHWNGHGTAAAARAVAAVLRSAPARSGRH